MCVNDDRGVDELFQGLGYVFPFVFGDALPCPFPFGSLPFGAEPAEPGSSVRLTHLLRVGHHRVLSLEARRLEGGAQSPQSSFESDASFASDLFGSSVFLFGLSATGRLGGGGGGTGAGGGTGGAGAGGGPASIVATPASGDFGTVAFDGGPLVGVFGIILFRLLLSSLQAAPSEALAFAGGGFVICEALRVSSRRIPCRSWYAESPRD